MAEVPERIGLCAKRVTDGKFVVTGIFLTSADDEEPVCEHCGEKLLVYVRQRTSLMAVDG